MKSEGLSFSIAAWAFIDDTGSKPEVPQVPAMLRRRASLADRLALKAAFEAWPHAEGIASIFCSQRGEEQRSVELLSQMAAGEGQSPMSFSLSVHNAASGLWGIARGDRTASTSLAAGKETFAMGLVEACAMLDSGRDKVLLVNYDEPIPETLKAYAEDSDKGYALALLLKAGSQFRQIRKNGAGVLPKGEPQGVRFAAFLKSGDAEMAAENWSWSRSA